MVKSEQRRRPLFLHPSYLTYIIRQALILSLFGFIPLRSTFHGTSLSLSLSPRCVAPAT